MADRFQHDDGVKAQDVKLRGKRLVRTGGGSIATTGAAVAATERGDIKSRIRRRRKKMQEQMGEAGRRAAGEVSGYLTEKEKKKAALDAAGDIDID